MVLHISECFIALKETPASAAVAVNVFYCIATLLDRSAVEITGTIIRIKCSRQRLHHAALTLMSVVHNNQEGERRFSSDPGSEEWWS